jgi:DNA invertase Pin-like site-specific DNA recombinase
MASEEWNRRETEWRRKPRSIATDGKGEQLIVGLYATVSTTDQNTENQLLELRRYVAARGWTGIEYVDHGVSGAKDRRPALDQLVAGVLASIAEFERARIQERIRAGLSRAKAQGTRLGRRPSAAVRRLDTCAGLSHAAAAKRLGVSVASIKRWRRLAA